MEAVKASKLQYVKLLKKHDNWQLIYICSLEFIQRIYVYWPCYIQGMGLIFRLRKWRDSIRFLPSWAQGGDNSELVLRGDNS